jgi:tetratricopeptide (TPR) repeat protein
MLALLWLLRPGRLGVLGSGTHAGAAAGVFALLLQNLADFSLELLGPSVACVMVLGALWGASGRRRPVDEPEQSEATTLRTRQRSLLHVAGVATIVFAVLAALRGAPTVTDSRDELSALFADVGSGSRQPGELDAVLRERLARHPADYFPALIGAAAALRGGGNPGPWIQRALELGPSVGRAHYLLAEILVRRGALGQALLELRLAATCESNLLGQVTRTALAWTRDPQLLATMAAPGTDGAAMLDALAAQALQLRELSLARTLSAQAVERDFGRVEAHARLAALGVRSLLDRTCEDLVECEEEVALHADAITRLRPNSARGEVLLAELALVDGDQARARSILRPACVKQEAQLDCLRQLAEIELPGELDASVDRYVALSCRASAACAEAHAWAGRLYAQRRQWGRALSSAERAVRLDPSRGRWLEVASYAASLGDETRARDARSRAAALDER